MMLASTHSAVNSVSSPENRGSRTARLENMKGSMIVSSTDLRKDPPLSPLSVNAIEERRLICGILDLNFQPANSKDDRDSSTNAMCFSGEKTPRIGNQDPVSLNVEYDNHRVVWSNAIFCRESSIEVANSIKEHKGDDADSGDNEVSNPFVTNLARKGQEKGEDNNSSNENGNSDAEFTSSNRYTSIAVQVSTSEIKREALIGHTEGKDLQCSNKALFCMGCSASQNVVDAMNNDSAIEHKEIKGKDETLVKNDCIDLGIEEIEKEISRLTQKLAELKLQKACETSFPLVDIQHISSEKNTQHISSEKNTPVKIANELETRKIAQEGSSEKKKRGRFVAAKFLQYNSKTQPRVEKKIAETATKSNGSWRSPQIQKKPGSSGPQLRRIASKVGCAKENKFEGKKDQVDRQLNPKKIDLSKDAAGDGCSSGRFDGKENISPCRSSLEKNLSFCPNSKSKEVATVGKKLGKVLPENSKKFCEISENKKLQKVSSNATVGNCSKEPLSNHADKVSPPKKQGRIVASRYAQITPPNRNASSPQIPAKLSSQRNVYGKRISVDMEVEDVKERLNNHSAKRPAVGCFVGSPSVKDFTSRIGYQCGVVGFPPKSGTPQKSPTPNSGTVQNSPTPYPITPQDSVTANEKKKTLSPWLKDGKTTYNLTTVLARRCVTRTNNQQSVRANWKEPSNRINTITAERSISKTFDPSTENRLGGSVSNMNQEQVSVQSAGQSCSAVFQLRDCLEPERMKLPKISTFRFTAKSPRDSGCLKRVVDQTGKHQFSISDKIRSTKLANKRNASSVSNSSRIEVVEIRQRLSFENETDTIDL